MLKRLRLDQDIKSVSDFRSNAAELIQQVKQSKRPLLLTQHGEGAVVLLDVSEFEHLIDHLELLQDIRVGEGQLADGLGIDQDEVESDLLMRFNQ